MLDVLSRKAHRLILTQFEGSRAMPVVELAAAAPDRRLDRLTQLSDAISLGFREAESSGLPLVITGSLFTAGQARRILIEDYQAPPLQF
jgi:folylpolyglutamate synthase/dihydropteroate synthase